MGQNVLAAMAKAHPTRIEISTDRARRARSAGTTIAQSAATRKRMRGGERPQQCPHRAGAATFESLPADLAVGAGIVRNYP
jgi:hypothetical protein